MQAGQFHQASILLYRFKYKYNSNVSFPIAICAAFVLELYMKCLLVLDEREVRRIHNLNELFNTLADAHKDKIRENFSYTPIDNEILLIVSKTAKFDFDLTFDSRLRYSADALQLFRYMHEVEAPIGNIIGWIAGPIKESARQTIPEIRPE